MGKLLYITANPKQEEAAFSLSVGRAFVEAYKTENPTCEVIELDLYKMELQEIDEDVLNARTKLDNGTPLEELSEIEKEKLIKIEKMTNLFISADYYVFASALWNLSIPPRLKTFFDNVVVARKTFRYTSEGVKGLLNERERKAIHIQSSGGYYSSGPANKKEFGNRYVKTILEFMGIHVMESIHIEGIANSANDPNVLKQQAIEKAINAAKEMRSKVLI